MFLFWILAASAVFLALFSLLAEPRRARLAARALARQPRSLPPACVIVPVKGLDDGLRDNLAALASLDYPDYRLIIAARTASDIPPGVLPSSATIVLAHGDDPRSSEKVQNLAAAVRAAGMGPHVYAFADSDGRVTSRWLRSLVTPLEDDGVGASTGYRWYLPEPAFWPMLRAVWNAAVLECLGPRNARFAWGGAMAMRRDTFFEIGMLGAWKCAISDDYALAAAVRRAGLRIAYAPGALVPSLDRPSAREFLSWARRQMLVTRFYDRPLWLFGLVTHAIYCGGMLASASAAVMGHRLAVWALAAQILPGMWKAWRRAAHARAALPEYAAWFRRHAWAHAALTPLATWVWLAVLLASASGREILWRGRKYDLRTR